MSDNYVTPALQVRAHLFRRIHTSLSSLAGRRKFYLCFTFVYVYAQVITYSVVLGVTAHDTCDSYLRIYLIVQVVRLTLAFIPTFYRFLTPQRPSPRNDTPALATARERNRLVGSPAWDRRMSACADLLSIFAFFWFIVGNVWLWSADSCRRTSPPLFYTVLASLITGFIYAAEIILLVLAVSFCLPLVIIIIRTFNLGPKHEIGPIKKSEMDKIPLVIYIPQEEPKPSVYSNQSTSVQENQSFSPTETITSAATAADNSTSDHNNTANKIISTVTTSPISPEPQSNEEKQMEYPTMSTSQTQDQPNLAPPLQDQPTVSRTSSSPRSDHTTSNKHNKFLRLFIPLKRKNTDHNNSGYHNDNEDDKVPESKIDRLSPIRVSRLTSAFSGKKKKLTKDQEHDIALRDICPYAPAPYPFHPLSDNASTCAICLEDYEEPPLKSASPETINEFKYIPLRLLPCGHAYHKDCLDVWLQTSARCPNCQAAVFPNLIKNNQTNASSSSSDDHEQGRGDPADDPPLPDITTQQSRFNNDSRSDDNNNDSTDIENENNDTRSPVFSFFPSSRVLSSSLSSIPTSSAASPNSSTTNTTTHITNTCTPSPASPQIAKLNTLAPAPTASIAATTPNSSSSTPKTAVPSTPIPNTIATSLFADHENSIKTNENSENDLNSNESSSKN